MNRLQQIKDATTKDNFGDADRNWLISEVQMLARWYLEDFSTTDAEALEDDDACDSGALLARLRERYDHCRALQSLKPHLRQAVTSSNIVSIGYDAEQQRLEVEFKGGRVYEYAEVPAEKHEALMRADSVGSFFARQVKNVYPCKRLSDVVP